MTTMRETGNAVSNGRTALMDAELEAMAATVEARSAGEWDGGEKHPRSLVVRAAEIPSRSIRWAWQGWLAIGYMVVMTGVEGLGKSLCAAWVIARLTRGQLPGDWRDQ
jgi:hypothetical protein